MERSSEQPCSVCGLVPLIPRLKGATEIVARSSIMQGLLKRVARFASSEAPVAVLGETGTGKEVIARTLHANSKRSKQAFVAVNVAALPADLLESELFGHGRGAFTGAANARRGLFEAAHQGTLFLDEIGEMPIALQAKLLRALQDGEVRRVGESEPFVVDVRVLCATHRDLAARVREGTFREDLFYRLKVLTLQVPPLRERGEDVLPLAYQFLAKENTRARGFARAAQQAMLAYGWPGNVRELENAVKHGAALATGNEVQLEDLPEELHSAQAAPSTTRSAPDRSTPSASGSPAPPSSPGPNLPAPGSSRSGVVAQDQRSLAEVEREHILRVLDACGGSQSDAARILGVGRNTLWRKLRSYSEL
ncbi:MAG TPA: sigma-54 dependent transcriptional regulator [Polyangiaceae bacterium]|nr:sigma-54 dependent transcriptional regulator [Polyangiaceae bacterium]